MLDKIKRTIGELGVVGAFMYAINRITEKAFRRRMFYDYLIVVQPVSATRERRKNPYRTHVFDSIESSEALAERFPAPPAVLRSRFEQGAVCIALSR